MITLNDPQELQREYAIRFGPMADYRVRVWQVLTAEFFQRWVPANGVVLDLGCGWGEFINHIEAKEKFGMDLNPDAAGRLAPGIRFLQQDCSKSWDVADQSLDVVFTSNFFEHLPTKESLRETLVQARRCLKPGGRLICLGPNARFLAGSYWDFWDHHLALTDRSLAEILQLLDFEIERNFPRFLPYTMVRSRGLPLFLIRLFLRVPALWWTVGKQFLVIARNPSA